MTTFPSSESPAWFRATPARPARPSATLVLVRDGDAGPEVLLVRRADRGDQNSNAWVFPGGLVDATDAHAHACCSPLDDAAASQRLGLPQGGLDYLVAALRETLEETGLLLAHDAQGQPVSRAAQATLSAWRTHAGTLRAGQSGAAFAQLCQDQGWWLPADMLHPISHWITPLGMPKRFDARFFIARAPDKQDVQVDGIEIVEHRWARPASVLQADADIHVMGPARFTLQALAAHADVAAMLAWATALGPIRPIQPRLGRDARGRIAPVQPNHPAYAEIGRVDPLGQGHARQTLDPGPVTALSPDLLRVTAPNGSVMTGPGTNTYFLCCDPPTGGPRSWVVIDPGPDDDAHLHALMAALPGRLQAILVTHTHPDHSPAARRLKTLTGATLYGRVADHPEWQDLDFQPDVTLQGGETLRFGAALTLRVIHTPGHASNHLCFLHTGERMLFTGDHVMQGSTVVINPPDGDMNAYLQSLTALHAAASDFDWIAPGHGFLIDSPARTLQALLRHRLQREAKVLSALTALAQPAPASEATLLARVYDDVPTDRHGLALRSLRAHLQRLAQTGQARQHDTGWGLA